MPFKIWDRGMRFFRNKGFLSFYLFSLLFSYYFSHYIYKLTNLPLIYSLQFFLFQLFSPKSPRTPISTLMRSLQFAIVLFLLPFFSPPIALYFLLCSRQRPHKVVLCSRCHRCGCCVPSSLAHGPAGASRHAVAVACLSHWSLDGNHASSLHQDAASSGFDTVHHRRLRRLLSTCRLSPSAP